MDQYVGEIRMFAGIYAPIGWAMCNGQLLSVQDNLLLYSLIGNSYGGQHGVTFGLPDLRMRVPLHQGYSEHGNYRLGDTGGVETVRLSIYHLPSHTHSIKGSSAAATSTSPLGQLPSQAAGFLYDNLPPLGTMADGAVSITGAEQAHNNLQPSLCINFIIAVTGEYPTREY